MYFRKSAKIFCLFSNFRTRYSIATNVLPNRRCILNSHRQYGTKEDKESESHDDDCCPNKTCQEKPKKKSLIWGLLTGNLEKVPVCSNDEKALVVTKKHNFVWGPAYRIETDIVPTETIPEEPPVNVTKKIEPDYIVTDMPDFTTVEQRLIDLNDRKLHPCYRIYQSFTKKNTMSLPERTYYKTRSGPISIDEIPGTLKIKQKVFGNDSKFDDVKRMDPPQQLVAKLAEIKKNERPTLEPNQNPEEEDSPPQQSDEVVIKDGIEEKAGFDTYQDPPTKDKTNNN